MLLSLHPTQLIKNPMGDEIKKQRPSLSESISNICKTNRFIELFRKLRSTMVNEVLKGPLFFDSYEWDCENLKPIDKRKENCNSTEFIKPRIQKYFLGNKGSSSVLSGNKFFSLCDFISGWAAGLLL